MGKKVYADISNLQLSDRCLNDNGWYETVLVWWLNSDGHTEIMSHAGMRNSLMESDEYIFSERKPKSVRVGAYVERSWEFKPVPKYNKQIIDANASINTTKQLLLPKTVKDYLREMLDDYSTYEYWCFNNGKEPISEKEFYQKTENIMF